MTKGIFKHLFKTGLNEYQMKRYYQNKEGRLMVEVTHYKKSYRKGRTYYKRCEQYAVYSTVHEFKLDVMQALKDNNKLAKDLHKAMKMLPNLTEKSQTNEPQWEQLTIWDIIEETKI